MFEIIPQEAVIYPRVSSEDQQERETIENQIEFGIKYSDLHQIHILDWYKDDGISGMIPLEERPEGSRLIEDAKSGKFKLLLVYNLKRLGRSARIILNAVYELEKYGVVIKSMTEPFDTSNPTGRFLLTILAGVAELDRETLLENMWHGANRHARLGKWLGGIVPFGYYVNAEGYPQINESPLSGKEDMTEASVMRLMYYLVAREKLSTIKVADYFNALHIPTSYVKDDRSVKRGKRKVKTAGIWRPARIGSMIANPMYKGLHVYGKRTKKTRELIERVVPAIVTEEEWDLAQVAMQENQIEALKNAKRQYLLRGLIKCGLCGLTFHGTRYSGANNEPTAYYCCNGKQKYNGPIWGTCPSKNVPAEWIEEKIWQNCLSFIYNPGDALQELAATMEKRQSNMDSLFDEKNRLILALQEKESERQAILDLFRKRVINAADVEQQLQSIAFERLTLEQRIKAIDEHYHAEVDFATQFISTEALLSQIRQKLEGPHTFELKREIVKLLVDEIIVTTTGTEEKNWRKRRATIRARFTFTPPQVVNRTGMDSSTPPA